MLAPSRRLRSVLAILVMLAVLSPAGQPSVVEPSHAATFSGLSIDQAGTGYVLTAGTPGSTSVDSSPFDVLAALGGVRIQRVSIATDGTQGDGASAFPALSADGRYLAFGSAASNLVPDDTKGADDIFVKDRQTGAVEWLSTASDGTQGNRTSG